MPAHDPLRSHSPRIQKFQVIETCYTEVPIPFEMPHIFCHSPVRSRHIIHGGQRNSTMAPIRDDLKLGPETHGSLYAPQKVLSPLHAAVPARRCHQLCSWAPPIGRPRNRCQCSLPCHQNLSPWMHCMFSFTLRCIFLRYVLATEGWPSQKSVPQSRGSSTGFMLAATG